ncbi:MAG: lipopolysaccharide heptosyltransferase II [Candidatus Omnitrophica bacterium]|nr:lipopolysaccharide heptosyltransferase II [Candidatus Omnitrophota bacterium]
MTFKNILVVNVNWLGDVIFSTPVFRALKEKYPEVRIACMAVPRVCEVLKFVPFVDEVIPLDEDAMKWRPWQWIFFSHKISSYKFDAVFLLHGSKTRAFLMKWAGIPVRVGYERKGRGKFLTHPIKSQSGKIHRSDFYMEVIRSFGVEVKNDRNILTVPEQGRERVCLLLNDSGVDEHKSFIVLHVCGNWDLKVWSEQNFTLLIRRLMNDFKMQVVIPGGKNDLPRINRIVASLEIKPAILAGQTDLQQLIHLLSMAQIVISSDSGPLHVANSVGTKVVGIFGPTRPEITGPRGTGQAVILQKDVGCNREPCYYLDCPDNVCVKALSVEDVCCAVRQIQNS